MLDRVDGVVVAVRDAAAAEQTYARALGCERTGEGRSPELAGHMIEVSAGTSRFVLAEPTGPGRIADHLDRHGEGIFCVRLSSRDAAEIKGVDVTGLFTVLVPFEERERMGPLSFLYEVTHLVHDWQTAAKHWATEFGLDESRFCPIASERYGYDGTLTLFDPPGGPGGVSERSERQPPGGKGRLDRIEVVTPYGDKAMARYFAKRGEGPYMCYAECDDVPALAARLDAAGARYAGRAEPRGVPGGGASGASGPPDPEGTLEGLFVHPSSLHGVLLGVSRTNLGWRWSGRPDLAG
jgi:hypothetical protein